MRTLEEKEELKRIYHYERVAHGKPRERWALYTLRLSLGDGFQVKRVRYREGQAEHKPDLRIYKAGRWVADVEVSGSNVPLERLAREDVRVLPSKLAYARSHDPDRYIYLYVDCVLWAPGRELLRALDHGQAEELVGDVGHGVVERYYVFPLDVFSREWHELVSYVLWLAGELADPNPLALVNFMPIEGW